MTMAIPQGGIPAGLSRIAYRTQQRGFMLPCLWAQRLLRFVARQRQLEPAPEVIAEVDRRYRELIERDLRNAEAGLYPRSLLFQMPVLEYLRRAPALAADVPRSMRRMKRRDFRDLPKDVDLERFPDYFRRNFHWQTDGYFSRRSAAIYDVGVELLFLGTADVMRRQVIPPISRLVRERGDGLRVLDVACGTGRTLLQLAAAHPRLAYYGLDLSPWYLQHARELLADVPQLSLVADNAERMPFRDGLFDAVTSVHLFHELPKAARRNVYAEMWRVLKPGGIVVIEDSAQRDAGELAYFLDRFSREFHEPYHRCYVRDDIGAALRAQGFEVLSTEMHFVAKVVVARKPDARASA